MQACNLKTCVYQIYNVYLYFQFLRSIRSTNFILCSIYIIVPKLNVANSGYHGLVRENETLVEVTPTIRAVGAEICSFRIINKHHIDAPFEVS